MSGEARHGRPQRGPGGGQGRPEKIRALLAPVVEAAGFDLEDLRIEPAGKRRLVRVIVDGDGGVSLDDITVVSQGVSKALDETDLMGSAPYALEVSSPGVDRPLTEPRHWRRAAGRLVTFPVVGDGGPGGEITARVLNADEGAVTVQLDGGPRSFGYDEVGRGRVQVEFSRRDAAEDTDEEEGGAS